MKCSEERRKNSERQLGQIPWNKGLTKEDPRVDKNTKNANKTRRKRLDEGSIIIWNKGLTKEDPRVEKYSKSMKISKTGKPNYKLRRPISNLTDSYSYFRYSFKRWLYTEWIFKILEKDKFKCKICNSVKNLEVHHLKKYKIIFEESIIELNLNLSKWKEWTKKEISSLQEKILEKHTMEIGITVCDLCHSILDEERKKTLRKNKKELLIEHEKRYFRFE